MNLTPRLKNLLDNFMAGLVAGCISGFTIAIIALPFSNFLKSIGIVSICLLVILILYYCMTEKFYKQ